jgi:Flp pilus assembly protein TadG
MRFFPPETLLASAPCLLGEGPRRVPTYSGDIQKPSRFPLYSRNSKRSGAAVLEFAIVAPVLFLIILGIIEVGRGLMVTHLLTNAARQGCRLGVIEGTSTAQISTVVLNTLKSQGINGNTVTIQVNDGVADASTAQAGDEITVLITVPASQVTWLPGARFLTGNLSGRYTLRRE